MSFEEELESLRGLDEAARAALPVVAADLLLFDDLMTGITCDGLLVTVANEWPHMRRLTRLLSDMGSSEMATALTAVASATRRRGLANGPAMDAERAQDDPVIAAAFEEAERRFTAGWDGLWDGAEAYWISRR